MGFLKNLFGKQETVRQLTKVHDLLVNDIIVLNDSFGLPERLRGKQFQVTAINSYEYEHNTQLEWVLTGQDDSELYLSLDVDDKTYLKFALKIEHEDVEQLFDLEQFAQVFDSEEPTELDKQADSALTEQWTSNYYRQQTYAQIGYFHRKDSRSENISVYQGKDAGEQFELYALFDQDQDKGIDIEVWSDGDTDVFLTLFRPLTDVVDFFPGS